MAAWEDFKQAVGIVKEGLERATDISTYPQGISVLANTILTDTLKGQDVKDIIPHISFEDRFMEGLQKFHEKGMNDPTQLAMDFMPGAMGVIHPNFRGPEQIQALRKMMAEEMKNRGLVRQAPGTIITPGTTLQSDPIDQILRGSWYRGMGAEERDKLAREVKRSGRIYQTQELLKGNPENWTLSYPYTEGFPISLHDSASKSNKLGEPAGVSISMLPTKAQQFSADEFIHRVLPKYGGSPVDRTVNLMTPEGRKALNDAYDVVANKQFDPKEVHRYLKGSIPDLVMNDLHDAIAVTTPIGPFNKQLSEQLQSMGKRGILYNPHRWNEYEMLMLDPKYLLPLDYRRAGEYMLPRSSRIAGYTGGGPTLSNRQILEGSATPGVQKGLDQIRDVMAMNKSRLGDIYSERPWTQRLNEENKNRLLELIDPQYREIVGNQLYGPSKPYDIPF